MGQPVQAAISLEQREVSVSGGRQQRETELVLGPEELGDMKPLNGLGCVGDYTKGLCLSLAVGKDGRPRTGHKAE